MSEIEQEIEKWVEAGESRRVVVEEDHILQITVVLAIEGYRVGRAAYSKELLLQARKPMEVQMAALKQAIEQVDPRMFRCFEDEVWRRKRC